MGELPQDREVLAYAAGRSATTCTGPFARSGPQTPDDDSRVAGPNGDWRST